MNALPRRPLPHLFPTRAQGGLWLAATLAASFLSGCASDPEPRHRTVVIEQQGPHPYRDGDHSHRRSRREMARENRSDQPNVIVVNRSNVSSDAQVVVVQSAPPAPRYESMSRRPSRNHVWITGHWRHDRGDYTWVPGHWARPPHRHSTYVAPRWERNDRGHIFIEGHWKD